MLPSCSDGISLKKNIAWTAVANILYGGSQWLILAVIAAFGTPQMVGEFALAQAIVNPAILFANLQLRVVQTTDAQNAFTFGHYLALRLTTTALATICLITFATLKFTGSTQLVIIALTATRAIDSISDVYAGLLQQYERNSRLSLSCFLKGLSSLVLLCTVLWTSSSLVAGTVALATASLSTLILFDIRSPAACHCLYARPVWEYQSMKAIARLALPLGVTMALSALCNSIPRYIVQHWLGASQLGVFSLLSSFQTGGALLAMAVGQGAAPKLARQFRERSYSGYVRSSVVLMWAVAVVGIGATVVVFAVGDYAVGRLFGPLYAGQRTTFTLIAASAMLTMATTILSYVFAAGQDTASQPKILVIAILLSCTICISLVPAHGICGAAIGAMTAATATLILYLVTFYRRFAPLRRGDLFTSVVEPAA